MKKIKIEDVISLNESSRNLFNAFEIFIKVNYENIKFPLFFLIIIVIFMVVVDMFDRENIIDLKPFKK